jgi:hypothetical protein
MTEEEVIAPPRKGLVNVRYSYVFTQGTPGYLPLPQELKRLQLNDFVRKFTSNYPGGNQCAEDFVTKKEQRALSKKPNSRSKQAKKNPADFTSQITFYVEHAGEQLQIKVFTRRSIHVPEIPTDDFSLAEAATQRLVAYFNESFAGCDFYSPIMLRGGNVMLSNYSGLVQVPKGHVLNLEGLASMLNEEVMGPTYCYTQFGHGDIKLKVFFHNPSPKNPYKTTSLPVQLSGKIVIMGDNNRERIHEHYYRLARLIYYNRLLLFRRAY